MAQSGILRQFVSIPGTQLLLKKTPENEQKRLIFRGFKVVAGTGDLRLMSPPLYKLSYIATRVTA